MSRDLPQELQAFSRRGRMIRLPHHGGHEVFTLDVGDGAEQAADPLLLLHGFPTSSFDFHQALPLLSRGRRVVVHDHLGFGLSDKPARYSYSLMEQADVALMVWQALGIRRGHILAHDYGTSVATELCARHVRGLLPIDLRSLTLCNGSVHLELAHLRITQRLLRSKLLGPLFARLSSRAVFVAQLRRIMGQRDAVSAAELDLMWAGIKHRDGQARLPQISGYLDERVRFHDRWISALTRLRVPVHVLWGRRDPIAVPAIAEQLTAEIPGARLTWLDPLGHYPMLEDPRGWAEAATAFLSQVV